jgi:PHP family Zn ribbon phosphoesterase
VGRYKADLHVHTCLSPCAELRMSPRTIVEVAAKRGIGIIGICDHNSAENVTGVSRAAAGAGIWVVAGMEVTTREEVHLVALFPGIEEAMVFQSAVYARLAGENDEDAFGMQVVANEHDEVLGFCGRLLIGATTMAIEDAVARIHGLGGLAIASHVDREGFGIIGQLGFVPDGLALDALEVSARADAGAVAEIRRQYPAYAMVRASDAHQPEQIGAVWTELEIEAPRFEELARALRGLGAVGGGG